MTKQIFQLTMSCIWLILFSISNGFAQNVNKQMDSTRQVTEVTIYQFKSGVTDEQALKAASSVNDFLKSQDGFISRRCSKTSEGQWVDVIIWETMQKAMAAADSAMKTAVCLAFFEKTEESSSSFLLAEEQFTIN